MRFIKKRNENLLIEEFIKILKGEIIKKKREKKRLSFVLTGGSSPKKLYKKLSRSNINWSNVDFWEMKDLSKSLKIQITNLLKIYY